MPAKRDERYRNSITYIHHVNEEFLMLSSRLIKSFALSREGLRSMETKMILESCVLIVAFI